MRLGFVNVLWTCTVEHNGTGVPAFPLTGGHDVNTGWNRLPSHHHHHPAAGGNHWQCEWKFVLSFLTGTQPRICPACSQCNIKETTTTTTTKKETNKTYWEWHFLDLHPRKGEKKPQKLHANDACTRVSSGLKQLLTQRLDILDMPCLFWPCSVSSGLVDH